MYFSQFFVICALETLALTAYLALQGSEPGATLLFNLSAIRLVLVAVFLVVALAFALLAWRVSKKESKLARKVTQRWQKERFVWAVFMAGLALTAGMLFLLTRQTNQFGDFKQVVQRFEPVIVWLAALGTQSALAAAVWYCAWFLKRDDSQEAAAVQTELTRLFGFYLLFVLLKLLLVTASSYGPLGRGDEMTYFDMADSFYRGFFSVAQTHHYPPLYPLSFLPALVFKGQTFEAIKLLNVLYSSSIIFPIYLLARLFLNPRQSMLAVLLTCLIPYHLAFPRRILSENLFFPLFMWAFLVTFSQPRQPKSRLIWDVLNGAILAALYLTRYISLAVIPFFLAAWWIKPFEGEAGSSLFRPGWKKVLHFLLLALTLLLAFSPWMLGGLREGLPLKLVLGFGVTARTDPAQLTLQRLFIWAVLYLCYYVLVSAPVLNLLLVSFSQVDFKIWREGLTRLLLQVLLLMGGFYAAVTRHSWRAYYNADLPSTIMGRYLVVFSGLYILIAVIVLARFERARVRFPWRFLLCTVALPFALVIFANLTLIQGAVFAIDETLFKALGSVDGILTEILGPFFFLLVALLYGLQAYLLLAEKRRYFLGLLTVGLLLYYLSGLPTYYRGLMDYQTYPWLSKQIAALLPAPDLKDPAPERVSVYLPAQRLSKHEAEIYNGLRVRGIDNAFILTDTRDDPADMPTSRGFIIRQLNAAETAGRADVYAFNGEFFTIQAVER